MRGVDRLHPTSVGRRLQLQTHRQEFRSVAGVCAVRPCSLHLNISAPSGDAGANPADVLRAASTLATAWPVDGRATACSWRRLTCVSAAAIASRFNANPTGEQLTGPFGWLTAFRSSQDRKWMQYRLEAGTGKSSSSTQLTVVRRLLWRRSRSVSVDRRLEPDAAGDGGVSGGRNVGHLPEGLHANARRQPAEAQPVADLRCRVTEYDTDSDSVGSTRACGGPSRRRRICSWSTITTSVLEDRWQFQSNQLLIKLQYAWRM